MSSLKNSFPFDSKNEKTWPDRFLDSYWWVILLMVSAGWLLIGYHLPFWIVRSGKSAPYAETSETEPSSTTLYVSEIILFGYRLPESIVRIEIPESKSEIDFDAKRGQLGDSFGMFTSLMGALSIFGLFYTFRTQKDSLAKQTEALREQREATIEERHRAIQDRYLLHVNEFWTSEFLQIRSGAHQVKDFLLQADYLIDVILALKTTITNRSKSQIEIHYNNKVYYIDRVEFDLICAAAESFHACTTDFVNTQFNASSKISSFYYFLLRFARLTNIAPSVSNLLFPISPVLDDDAFRRDTLHYSKLVNDYALVLHKLSISTREFLLGSDHLADLLYEQWCVWWPSILALVKFVNLDKLPTWYQTFLEYSQFIHDRDYALRVGSSGS
jgi:hypothetical protein